MLRTSVPTWVVAAFLTIAATACEKNSGEAEVLEKKHIDAALPTAETPNAKSASSPDEKLRPMADDEIAVDGYVMKLKRAARVPIRALYSTNSGS